MQLEQLRSLIWEYLFKKNRLSQDNLCHTAPLVSFLQMRGQLASHRRIGAPSDIGMKLGCKSPTTRW